MDDLEKFVNFLFEGQQGFVYSPVKKPDKWEEAYFSWPLERQGLIKHIRSSSNLGDVYLAPALFVKKNSKRESFKSSQVVWVEFDGKEHIDFKGLPKPDAIVQTSSETHVHAYWKTGTITDGPSLEDLNKRLTYYLQADSSGAESNQVLRPPESQNQKRGGVPVTLVHFEPGVPKAFASFDEAPEVPAKKVEITEAQLLDPVKLLNQLPLLKSLKFKIERESPAVGDRSQFMYKIAHELAEIGCNHSQVATLLNYINDRIGKFPEDRSDRLTRISEMASIAIHSVEQEQDISVYTPKDILEFTEELQWLIEKWLHQQGLLILTGAPGVGKTQLAIQMAHAFSVGGEFLGQQVSKTRTLFMSLEMDTRELKFLLQKQVQDFDDLSTWFSNSLIMDEPGSLLQYEELIERTKPGLVIIDSLLELSDGDLKESTEVLQLTRWMKRIRRKYNCAFIIISHTRKNSSTGRKPNRLEDNFGSVVLNKDIDTALCLWQEDGQPYIELLVIKSRYAPREDFKIARSDNLTFSRYVDPDPGEPTEGKGVSGFFRAF